ncbi:hypothetical protein [Rugamonas apoptosis]|uniref:Uncharacterized protein n=1 Tax=Rugamonas apoptosis TaxID=2758570 RepID=A0A7W2FCQ3_9BURK|nr:hypothetical protein [Rugamonas apoptosis]MBA5689202.1 hypothetical protein [Rugamonas apoptosis]
MDNWKTAVGKAVVPGAMASVASAAALALCAKKESGHMFAAANAISHWLWGDQAFRQNGPTWKYTVLGYGIHHASSMFWATLFEQAAGKMLVRHSARTTLVASAAATAVACFVDYQMTPERLRPGYEERLSRRSLALVYAAFGIGLAAGSLINHQHQLPASENQTSANA